MSDLESSITSFPPLIGTSVLMSIVGDREDKISTQEAQPHKKKKQNLY